MINIKDVKVGNCVMYKDRVCNIVNIDSNRNSLLVKTFDGYFYGPNCNEVEPIEIQLSVLPWMEYDEIFPGVYKDVTNHVRITYNEEHKMYEVTVEKSGTVFVYALVNYIHELQNITNHYAE